MIGEKTEGEANSQEQSPAGGKNTQEKERRKPSFLNSAPLTVPSIVNMGQKVQARESAATEGQSEHPQNYAVNTHPYFNFWNMFMLQPNSQFAGIVYLNPLQSMQWARDTFSPHINDF